MTYNHLIGKKDKNNNVNNINNVISKSSKGLSLDNYIQKCVLKRGEKIENIKKFDELLKNKEKLRKNKDIDKILEIYKNFPVNRKN